MVTLDVEYARVWTVWLDIKLIVLTVPMMLIQRGAR
jgi:lipopolysaccharide/colanic/teichoic acid biosynthesis glycosyltransferase